MTKAEKAALLAYPDFDGPCDKPNSMEDSTVLRRVRKGYEEGYINGAKEMYDFIHEFAHHYAWTEEDGNVHLPTFMHDFMKEARQFNI